MHLSKSSSTRFLSLALAPYLAAIAFASPPAAPATASSFPDSPSNGASTPATRALDAIARGAAWLEARQAEDGSWSNPAFPALTALPAWALSAAPSAATSSIARAAAFVRSCAQPDGGIYIQVPGRRGGALGTYNTAICMTALHFADNPGSARVIQKARDYVAATQLVGDDGPGASAGGFGYERNSPGGYADLNNSAWAVAAMRLTQDVEEARPAGEAHADINWDAARAYVSSLQVKPGDDATDPSDAGGFLYRRDPQPAPAGRDGQRGPGAAEAPAAGRDGQAAPGLNRRPPRRSYGSITYSGLEAMIFAQVSRSDPRVVSAIDYARHHWTLDENPGMGQQGLFYYYTIMARALSVLELDSLPSANPGDRDIHWRDELIDKIVSLQNPDGSWQNANNRFWENDPVLCTSYSLLALEYALRMF